MQKSHKVRNVIIGLIVLLVLAGVGAAAYVVLNQPKAEKKETTVLTGPANKNYKAPEPLLPTIVYKNEGFTQPTYSYPAGIKIRVDNQSKKDLEFSSDDHPTHKKTPGLNVGVIKAGESDTFTPPGKGSYGFHDHINAKFKGTLTIQ